MSKRNNGQKTILIVEDDHELRSAMKRQLKSYGYRVMAAEDDDEAVEFVDDASCQPPDLILTDLEMPFLDRFIKRARAHERLREVPIVAVDPDYADRHYDHLKVLEDFQQLKDSFRQQH